MFSPAQEFSITPLTNARMAIVHRNSVRFLAMKTAMLTTMSAVGVSAPMIGIVQRFSAAPTPVRSGSAATSFDGFRRRNGMP